VKGVNRGKPEVNPRLTCVVAFEKIIVLSSIFFFQSFSVRTPLDFVAVAFPPVWSTSSSKPVMKTGALERWRSCLPAVAAFYRGLDEYFSLTKYNMFSSIIIHFVLHGVV
jgi:hypothetical protein